MSIRKLFSSKKNNKIEGNTEKSKGMSYEEILEIKELQKEANLAYTKMPSSCFLGCFWYI